MATLEVTDPKSAPRYAPSAFQRWVEGLLYDPRDAVFVRLTLRSVAVMLPLFVLTFVYFRWWLALIVSAVQLPLMAPPVILMLHNTMHRPFIKKVRVLNRVHPYLMSFLFGIPTGYMEHHVAMHHVENNLRADLSSTMHYQRDSFVHWLGYFFRFFLFIQVELGRYLVSRRRRALAWRAVTSDLAHIGVIVAFMFVDWRPTLVLLLFPYVAVRFMMMIGNWGQHAFIDVTRPGDSYANSITCINVAYNKRCFNDGYHIGHHVKQNRHWTEMPQDFLDHLERYRKEGCVVFQGLDFFMVSVLLFLGRYDVLARRFVRLPGDERSDAEIIAFLKERTRRIPADVPEGVVMNA